MGTPTMTMCLKGDPANALRVGQPANVRRSFSSIERTLTLVGGHEQRPPANAHAEEEVLLFNFKNASMMRAVAPAHGACSMMAKMPEQRQQRRQHDDGNSNITVIATMPV